MNAFELRCGERPVDLPMSARRLLAFLALRGCPTERVHVAGALWLDVSEERANANLRSALWRLRRPGHRVVESRGTRLALAAHMRVDVHRAEGQARRLIADAEPRPLRLDALELEGELLPGWYEDWVLLERERFRQLALHGLEALGERLVAAGRYAEAADVALCAVAREPLRESAHRLLIRVHLAEGNRSEALRGYRIFSELTERQLGVPPSPELRSLVGGMAEV
ncbi:MAG TPA: BTAD domain-containing putative transcriptional regulator [Solirubrobacterales bacterium]